LTLLVWVLSNIKMTSNKQNNNFIMSANIVTEDDLYNAMEWSKTWRKETEEHYKANGQLMGWEEDGYEAKMCPVPCETKPMMGRSWYKCLGYHNACSCAEQAHAQKQAGWKTTSIIGGDELTKKMSEFNEANGIQEPETIDIDKLEATLGKGSVRSVTNLAAPKMGAMLDANGEPIHFKYYLFAVRFGSGSGLHHAIQQDPAALKFCKYVVDKYPNWDTDDSWEQEFLDENEKREKAAAEEAATKKKKLKLKVKKPEPEAIIPLTFNKTTRLGECGLQEETNKLYIPFFLMGACGVDEAAISWDGDREVMPVPKKLNLLWFKKVADKLEKHPYWDWDWESFRKNILKPNREHLKQVLNINDDKVDTLLCDGFVFINNFSKDWADEGEEYVEDFKNGDVGHFPNFTNFLKHDNLEY